jgi:hypothetical protein
MIIHGHCSLINQDMFTNNVTIDTHHQNGDRLGGFITCAYLPKIFIAHYYNTKLTYIENHCFEESIFVKTFNKLILRLSDNPNTFTIDYKNILHIFYVAHPLTLSIIKCDYVSYFKQFFYNDCRQDLIAYANEQQYVVPFDPKKVILIHLRLDDTKYWPAGTHDTCNTPYVNFINNDEIESSYNSYCNYRQAPIDTDVLLNTIDEVKIKYPEREIIIITSPGEKIDLPYKVISNDDASLDLYLLCNTEVAILSRSTFGFIPLLLGILKDAYIPKWCHTACFGLTTKYDRTTHINYI